MPKLTLQRSIFVGLAIFMVAVPGFVSYCWNQTRIQRRDITKSCVQDIEKALEIYARRHNGKLPDTLHDMLHSEEHPGEHITDCLTGAYYSFLDCWGTPFDYQRDGATFKLRSAGPDMKLNTADDITN